MSTGEATPLWELLSASGNLAERFLYDTRANIRLDDLVHGSTLGGRLDGLRGRSVLLATQDQLTAALALIELDGVARRMVLCPPDVPREHLAAIADTAAADAVVSDSGFAGSGLPDRGHLVLVDPVMTGFDGARAGRYPTEWILLTSGTTGVPKLVAHTLASLAGATRIGTTPANAHVWSTFYDIRRYGGLQIFLRAMLGGASLVLSSAAETTADFLTRAAAHMVTHVSGTPSHWRRALMSPAARRLSPRYVRMSGEIADQAIIDHLRAFFEEAEVAHAFASTEAGVAFDVRDGLAGFPAALIEQPGAAVEMTIRDGSLHIRSSRTASRYLGSRAEPLAGRDGFVDTGDMLERRGDRYHFVGRRGGIINVGGQKIHPEEVEAVINRHPGVRMSLVKARRSPIIGAIVAADIVVEDADGSTDVAALKEEILDFCRLALAPHKVPATIRIVPSLAVGAAGKLARLDA